MNFLFIVLYIISIRENKRGTEDREQFVQNYCQSNVNRNLSH